MPSPTLNTKAALADLLPSFTGGAALVDILADYGGEEEDVEAEQLCEEGEDIGEEHDELC